VKEAVGRIRLDKLKLVTGVELFDDFADGGRIGAKVHVAFNDRVLSSGQACAN